MGLDVKQQVGSILVGYDPAAPQPTADALRALWLQFEPKSIEVIKAELREEQETVGIPVEVLRDIDRETVNFVPNYDESEQEPAVLPARFPQLLVNGAGGIAVDQDHLEVIEPVETAGHLGRRGAPEGERDEPGLEHGAVDLQGGDGLAGAGRFGDGDGPVDQLPTGEYNNSSLRL